MAKVTLKDILSKVSNIFKNDIYIYKRRYIVGGAISEARNISRFFCVVNIDLLELMDIIPEEPELVYLEDVKKMKEKVGESLVTEINDSTKDEIISFINTTIHKVNKVKEWDNFGWSEEDISKIFDNNETFLLFENDKKNPNVLISKSLFPLVTKKNCDKLYYHTNLPKEKTDLIELIISFDHELFQIYNIITYLDLDVEIEE